jgi:hypothetical protein
MHYYVLLLWFKISLYNCTNRRLEPWNIGTPNGVSVKEVELDNA